MNHNFKIKFRYFIVLIILGISQLGIAQNTAIIIGNAKYSTWSKLRGPYQDVELIEQNLNERNFTTFKALDIRYHEMEELLSISKYDAETELLLIYYAGIGLSNKNKDSLFIVPIEADFEFNSVFSLDKIYTEIDKFHRENENNSLKSIIILDASLPKPTDLNNYKKRIPKSTIVFYGGEVIDSYEGKGSPFLQAFLAAIENVDGGQNNLFIHLYQQLLEACQKTYLSEGDYENPYYLSNLSNPLDYFIPSKIDNKTTDDKSSTSFSIYLFSALGTVSIVLLLVFFWKTKQVNKSLQKMDDKQIDKEKLKKQLAHNKTAQVIDELTKIEKVEHKALLISAAFNKLLDKRHKGISDSNEDNLEHQKINNSLLELIEKL